MKHWQNFLMTALVAWLSVVGCDMSPTSSQSPTSEPAAASRPIVPAKPSAAVQGPMFSFVEAKMVVLQLPLGSVSQSGDIWTYLSEEAVVTAGGNNLAANGIRVGLGKSSDWPEMAAILTALSGRELSLGRVILRSDATTPVNLKQDQPIQTIFLCNADGTLTGADYAPGDNIMMMTALVSMEDRKSVLLTGNLAIQVGQRPLRFQSAPAGYTLAAEQRFFTLPGMQFKLTVPPGGIIVIVPSSQSSRTSSVGNHFLIRQREGISFETVLVLMPEAMTAPVNQGQ